MDEQQRSQQLADGPAALVAISNSSVSNAAQVKDQEVIVVGDNYSAL